MNFRFFFTYFLICVTVAEFCSIESSGQNKSDTTKNSIINSKLTKEIIESITVSSNSDTVFNQKSEDPFLPYAGKIIRNIYVKQIGFERSFYDGHSKVRKTIVNIGNKLHSTTKEKVIRDNLFIREKKPLNPYKVADNERYLRDLEFLLDARIVVRPVKRTDSVDLVILTRDVFSLGGRFSPRGTTDYRFGLYDANLSGRGQRLEFNGVFDYSRDPNFGPEFIYTKNSIQGTLINGSIGFTALNTSSSYGDENENAVFLKLNRPLVSPYTRMAGGLELSLNWSENVFLKSPELFLKYRYNVYDIWAGYNIGVNNAFKNRNRHFVALRWFQQDFTLNPIQSSEKLNPIYNDNSFLLAEMTFFQQNFYKTRYIYGFGRTEDVPYGHSMSVAFGTSRQLNLTRTYVGAGVTKKVADRNGDFFEGDVRAATFLHDGKSEDATLLFSSSWFSRLLTYERFSIRQYVKASYAVQLNRTINEPLNIGNEFGVRGFRTDSLRGEQRLGITSETVWYTKWKLLGFRFAPLAFFDLAFLPPLKENIFYDKPFLGVGTGIRTRNENLILGTIELRFTYYPRTTEDISPFNINLSSNLRVKYTGTFVRAPNFLQFN